MSQSRRRERAAATPRQSAVARQTIPDSGASGRDSASRAITALTANAWSIGLLALIISVALHLGALDWFTDVPIVHADGSTDRLPNTFGSIDHPFHIAKERAVLDALRDGAFPRWISNHQAGYPAEFYPLGADFIVAAAWAAGFGLIPLEVVHKLVVIGVLFIPIAAYWSIARRDALPASVAVTAALLHLFVPGGWLGGGPDELLRMGMWPNVLASYLMLPLMLWSADYLRRDSRRGFALAALVAALAVYTNPRSMIAVAVVMASVGIVVFSGRDTPQPGRGSQAKRRPQGQRRNDLGAVVSPLVGRILLLGATILLLCAALIVPLRARQDLYEFTRFVEFSSPSKIWEYFTLALPIEVWALAIAGVLISAQTRHFHTRVLALWLPLSTLTIVILGWALRDLALFEQLEAPRLLPMVRVPAIFLAAVGIHGIVSYMLTVASKRDIRSAAGIIAVVVTALLVLTRVSMLSPDERGLPSLETTNQPAFVAIERSARVIESNATAEDRPLIIGSSISDHASFWIPALTGSNAFHAAWVWYWHTPAYADQTIVAGVPATLDLDFLRRNGLTMVLVSTNERDLIDEAASKPYLISIDPGTDGGYAIFRVDDADPSTRGPIAISDGSVTSLDVARKHLEAELTAPGPARVTIAINDYPAWRAQVNGHTTAIQRSDDGYMVVDVPAGDSELNLTYVIEPVVWLGRAFTLFGFLLLLAVVVWPRSHAGSSAPAQRLETRVRYPLGRGGTRDQHE